MIRGALADEMRFVWSAWRLHEIRRGQLRQRDSRAWNRLAEQVAKPETTLVATNEDGLVDGFLVFGERAVLFLYVRLSARRRGVARALLEHLSSRSEMR